MVAHVRSPLALALLVALASATRLESFHAGMRAHRAGELDEALSHFRSAIKASGSLGADDVSLNIAAGELMVQSGLADEAVEVLRRAVELCAEHNLGPAQHAVCQYSLAVAIEEAGGGEAGGDEALVEALYRQASSAGLVAAHFNLAVLLGRRVGNATAMLEALNLYGHLVKHEPTNAKAWSNMASALRRTGRHSAAGLARAHALAAAPSDAELWIAMSDAFRTGLSVSPWLTDARADPWGERVPQPTGGAPPPDLRSARRCLRRALRLAPDHPKAAHMLAMCEAGMAEAAAAGGVPPQRDAAAPEEAAWWAARLGEDGEEEEEDDDDDEDELGFGWAAAAASVPRRASGPYLAATFDAQAAAFDFELGKLRYAAPQQLHDLLAAPRFGGARRRFGAVLDLGCGTGLCAPLWQARARTMIGVDVSSAMLDEARKRGGYAELLLGEILDDVLPSLRSARRRFELVLAADTLIYFGDLREVFRRVAGVLGDDGGGGDGAGGGDGGGGGDGDGDGGDDGAPRALFALSLERLPTGDTRPWALQPSGTYAHSLRHVAEAAGLAGLQVEAHDESQSPRLEAGEPVPGLLVVLGRKQPSDPPQSKSVV